MAADSSGDGADGRDDIDFEKIVVLGCTESSIISSRANCVEAEGVKSGFAGRRLAITVGASLKKVSPSIRHRYIAHTNCDLSLSLLVFSDNGAVDAFDGAWLGKSALYINFLRGFSFESRSVLTGLSVGIRDDGLGT